MPWCRVVIAGWCCSLVCVAAIPDCQSQTSPDQNTMGFFGTGSYRAYDSPSTPDSKERLMMNNSKTIKIPDPN
jgi:hypothetical protein